MKDGDDADGLAATSDPIDNSVRPESQRREALEPASKSVPGLRIGLEQSDRVEYGFGDTDVWLAIFEDAVGN